MIGDLKLLEILFIILRVSNSGIIIHNDPAANYSSEFTRVLTANLTQFCSINIDKEPSAFRDIYRIRPAVIFDFGLKINTLADLPPKEPNGSYTEINVYKLDPIKCVESPVDQSFKNSADDLEVSLRHICMINDTHFGTEAGYILNTYPFETFRKSIDEISDNYEDQESMKRYEKIWDDFGYQKCQKECARMKMANSSSQIGLMRSCSHCHDCIVFEREENYQSESIYAANQGLITFTIAVFIGVAIFLVLIRRSVQANFWPLELLLMLKLVLFLSNLDLLPAANYLKLCTVEAVVQSCQMTLIPLDALSNLKFKTLNLDKLKFLKRRLKSPTIAEVAFLPILVTCSGLVVYHTYHDEDIRAWAVMCKFMHLEAVFISQALVISVLSTVLIYTSRTTEAGWKVSIFLVLIIELVREQHLFIERWKLHLEADLWCLVYDMYPIVFLVLIKLVRARAVDERRPADVRSELGESIAVEERNSSV